MNELERESLRHARNGQWLCASFRQHIATTCSSDTCAFIARLPPSEKSIHYTCNSTRCDAHVSEDACIPQHCVPGCDCPHVQAPTDKIKKLVNSRAIPLLRIHRSRSGALRLEAVTAKFGDRYIAVSHVWTGGLGNPRANALPECQLNSIAATGRQVRELIEGARPYTFPNLFRRLHRALSLGDIDLFWVDTLCIPVREKVNGRETDESKDVRAAAIDRMTQIYAGAHSVVIIDPELRSLPNNLLTSDREQFFGRLLRSDWMRRCWTYQEGAMGGRLFALLQSGLVYVTREHYNIRNNPSSSPLLLELTKWLERLPAPRRSREYHSRLYITGTEQETFAEVWNNLLARTTTRDGDRLLIFALMVNLVPGRLCSQESWEWTIERKLRIIFSSLNLIPMDFLFDHSNDVNYWLPERIRERISLTGGQLTREDFQQNFLSFDSHSANTGKDRPAMYTMSVAALRRGYVTIGPREDCFRIHLDTPPQLGSQSTYVLLLKDTGVPGTPSGDEIKGVLLQVTSDDGPKWILKRLCTCALLAQRRLQGSPEALDQDLLLIPDLSFYIECSFDSEKLAKHRDLDMPSNPGQDVVIPIYMHRDAHLCLFFFAYMALTGIIAGTPNTVNFPPVWMILIIHVGAIPIIVGLFDTMIRIAPRGDDIMHLSWMNALTPDWPDALPRNVRMMLHVNYGPKQTCFRIALSVTFIACGIAYRQNRDRRVMTVLGIMWFLELVLRWVLELIYNHYWKVNTQGTHPLLQEFLIESRLTRWCKKLVGWPRAAITEEDNQRNMQNPLFDWIRHV